MPKICRIVRPRSFAEIITFCIFSAAVASSATPWTSRLPIDESESESELFKGPIFMDVARR